MEQYNYDLFVHGPENTVAYRSLRNMLDRNDKEKDDLLYIYGRTGVGKTHLLKVFYNEISFSHPGLKVLYTEGETFVNESVDSIRSPDPDGLNKFRDKYQQADILLFDDLLALEGLEHRQRELLELIREYRDAHKIMVITAPYHMENLNLTSDLRNVLLQAKTVEIKEPGSETRLEILKRNAAVECPDIDPEVLQFIADHIKENGFRLLGALKTVVSSAKLTHEEINTEFAGRVLEKMLSDDTDGMIDYIRSESVKKYLKENGIFLSDKLKYALICNNSYSYPQMDVEWSLKKLARETNDEEVREQAAARLRQMNAEYEFFRKDRGNEYFYNVCTLDNWSHNYEPMGNFRTLSQAEMYIGFHAEDGADSKIELDYVFSGDELVLIDDEYDSWKENADSGTAYYNDKGDFLYCSCNVEEPEKIENPIEERWFPFPHPFRRGDILKSLDPKMKDMRYIVISCAGSDEIADQYKKQACRNNAGLIPTWDTITFEVIPIDIRTGIVWDQDEPMYPYDFEYAEVSEDYESVLDQMLIQMSKMVKGEPFSMQYIQNAQMKLHEDYDNTERYQLITGLKLRKSSIGKCGVTVGASVQENADNLSWHHRCVSDGEQNNGIK